MRSVGFLIAFVMLVCVLTKGNALKCYEYQCSNMTFTQPGIPSSYNCQIPKRQITCKPFKGMPMAPDSCSITKSQMSTGNMNISMEVGNCSYSAMCICPVIPNMKCDMRCCKGDLCNGAPIPSPSPKPKPTGPVGKDLSCYVCGSTTGSPIDSKCVKPEKRACGMDITGRPQDSCITKTAMVKSPDAKSHKTEMRNCSSSFMCNQNMICSSMPNVTNCKVDCCQGNLCNTMEDGTVPSISTTPKETGAPSVTTNTEDSNPPGSTVSTRSVSSVPSHLIQNTKCFNSILALVGLTIWLV